jgi:hypothetical protein
MMSTSHDDVISGIKKGGIYYGQAVHFPKPLGGAMFVGWESIRGRDGEIAISRMMSSKESKGGDLLWTSSTFSETPWWGYVCWLGIDSGS